MARVKINEFPVATTIADNDLGVKGDATTGIGYKITWLNIVAYLLGKFMGYHFLTQASSYYSSASGGSITIPSFNTDYPTLSANGIVRMQGWITVDGTATGGTIAQSEVDLIPVVTRDASGNITAATFNFGIDGTITTFKLRMY